MYRYTSAYRYSSAWVIWNFLKGIRNMETSCWSGPKTRSKYRHAVRHAVHVAVRRPKCISIHGAVRRRANATLKHKWEGKRKIVFFLSWVQHWFNVNFKPHNKYYFVKTQPYFQCRFQLKKMIFYLPILELSNDFFKNMFKCICYLRADSKPERIITL